VKSSPATGGRPGAGLTGAVRSGSGEMGTGTVNTIHTDIATQAAKESPAEQKNAAIRSLAPRASKASGIRSVY